MTDAPLRVTSHPDFLSRCGAALGLAALILLVHGVSLQGGLFMDDYAHIRQLRAADWNLADLTAACRLELIGGIADVWWMPECTLRFFRPVSFAVMKLTYELSGWSPLVMHAANLMWHFVVCLLLMQLLRRLGFQWLHAWITTALFAVHPGHVNTVQWIAVQTELLVTVFLLVGTLAFARFRGWPVDEAGTPPAQFGEWWAGAMTAACYLLALGCRENAILYPLVLAAAEPLVGKRGRRGAVGFYAILLVLAVGYLFVRTHYLGGAQLPPRPYIYPPGDPGFVRFIIDKFLYYLLGEFLLFPCIPIGGIPYLRGMPGTFYTLSALIVLLLLINVIGWRRRSPGWLGVAWLTLLLLPLLPAFASSHHLYLPGVGAAIVAAWALRGLLHRTTGGVAAARAQFRANLIHAGGAAAIVFFIAMSLLIPGLSIDTAQRVEDTVAQEVMAAPRGLKNGDTIYIANLPIIAHYLKLIIEERSELRDLRVVPLTWAPRVLGMRSADAVAELIWLDQQTFDILIRGDEYFAGNFGRLTAEALGRPMPVTADQPVAAADFTVELIEGDPDGITHLRYRFRESPLRDNAHLFWGSRLRWGYEIQRVGNVVGR